MHKDILTCLYTYECERVALQSSKAHVSFHSWWIQHVFVPVKRYRLLRKPELVVQTWVTSQINDTVGKACKWAGSYQHVEKIHTHIYIYIYIYIYVYISATTLRRCSAWAEYLGRWVDTCQLLVVQGPLTSQIWISKIVLKLPRLLFWSIFYALVDKQKTTPTPT